MAKTNAKALEKELAKIGIRAAIEVQPEVWLPTGSVALDYAISGDLTRGGWPLGRIVELYGDPSTGKSLVVGHSIAEAQNLGWWSFLDDAENALDPTFYGKLGVDLENVFVSNSETVEGHFRRVSRFINWVRQRDQKTPILVVLDSLAALSTEHESGRSEQLADDAEMPELQLEKRDMTKAQIVRAGLRVLATQFKKQGVVYVVVNHTTQIIGAPKYSDPVTTPGGSGVKFHASIRVLLSGGETYKNAEGPTGHKIRALIKKNKVAPPYKKVAFDMFFASGIAKTSGVLDILQAMGVVSQGGGWYTWKGEPDKKVRSKDLEDRIPEIIEWLKINKDSCAEAPVDAPDQNESFDDLEEDDRVVIADKDGEEDEGFSVA